MKKKKKKNQLLRSRANCYKDLHADLSLTFVTLKLSDGSVNWCGWMFFFTDFLEIIGGIKTQLRKILKMKAKNIKERI